MSDPRSIGIAGSKAADYGLDDLTAWINQYEQALGPVEAIGKDAEETVVTFDMAAEPPTEGATVRLMIGDTPTGPGDLVCSGKAYVHGQAQKVAVFR